MFLSGCNKHILSEHVWTACGESVDFPGGTETWQEGNGKLFKQVNKADIELGNGSEKNVGLS